MKEAIWNSFSQSWLKGAKETSAPGRGRLRGLHLTEGATLCGYSLYDFLAQSSYRKVIPPLVTRQEVRNLEGRGASTGEVDQRRDPRSFWKSPRNQLIQNREITPNLIRNAPRKSPGLRPQEKLKRSTVIDWPGARVPSLFSSSSASIIESIESGVNE